MLVNCLQLLVIPDSLKDKNLDDFSYILGPPWYSLCLAFYLHLFLAYHFHLQYYQLLIFFFNIPWCLELLPALSMHMVSWLIEPGKWPALPVPRAAQRECHMHKGMAVSLSVISYSQALFFILAKYSFSSFIPQPFHPLHRLSIPVMRAPLRREHCYSTVQSCFCTSSFVILVHHHTFPFRADFSLKTLIATLIQLAAWFLSSGSCSCFSWNQLVQFNDFSLPFPRLLSVSSATIIL